MTYPTMIIDRNDASFQLLDRDQRAEILQFLEENADVKPSRIWRFELEGRQLTVYYWHELADGKRHMPDECDDPTTIPDALNPGTACWRIQHRTLSPTAGGPQLDSIPSM